MTSQTLQRSYMIQRGYTSTYLDDDPTMQKHEPDSAHGRKGPSEERSDRAIREEQCTNLNARRREIDVDERHDSARLPAEKRRSWLDS